MTMSVVQQSTDLPVTRDLIPPDNRHLVNLHHQPPHTHLIASLHLPDLVCKLQRDGAQGLWVPSPCLCQCSQQQVCLQGGVCWQSHVST